MNPMNALIARLGKMYRSGVSLAMLAQLLQLGMGLFIIPVALVRLTSAELGLWYVFFSIQATVMLLDFGFTQTFSRNFAYLFGGTQLLRSEGLAAPSGNMPLHPGLLAATILGARRLYLLLTCVAALALATIGTAYVLAMTNRSGLARVEVLSGWTIFCLAACASIYFQWQTALLNGANRVAQNYKIGIASRVAQLVVSVIGLSLAPSIVTLALAYAVSVAVGRVYNHYCMRDLIPTCLRAAAAASPQSPREILGILWHGASRLGLVFLGGFLITRSNTFSVSYFLGLETSARYSVALQCFTIATGLAQTAFAISSPKISGARIAGDANLARSLFVSSLTFSWIVYGFLAAALIGTGPYLLHLLGSKTQLPDLSVMFLLALVLALEMNHALCANAIVSGNRVPFVWASLISGAAIVAGTIATGLLGGGLFAFIAVQGLVQLAYNNWKWPLVIMRDLNISTAHVIGRAKHAQ